MDYTSVLNYTNIYSAILIVLFLLILLYISRLKGYFGKSFNFRVLTALILGLIFGGVCQLIFKSDSNIVANLSTFTGIFSGIYINLLQLIVIPLIFVSITLAIINAPRDSKLGKTVVNIIAILLITVGISASVGITTTQLFHMDGQKIIDQTSDTAEEAQAVSEKEATLQSKQNTMSDMSYVDYILAPIPTDFSFLVGVGSTAALSTVIFGGFLGYCVIQIRKRKPEKPKLFIDLLESFKSVVLSMTKEVLKLTPIAIFALMTSFMATSSLASLGELAKFVIATYVAIIIMYIVHLIIVAIFGISPIKYITKTWDVLVFGFGARSSLAAIPLNVETQVERFGVDEATANLSATFGATIGQNGCAGIYPAMIATMAAPIYGIQIDLKFIIMLIIVIIVSSFGIAGVGGGASFAAIAVLSIMGLPIEMAAILVAVEPLLDMARTMLNISDSMVAGIVTAKINGTIKQGGVES